MKWDFYFEIPLAPWWASNQNPSLATYTLMLCTLFARTCLKLGNGKYLDFVLYLSIILACLYFYLGNIKIEHIFNLSFRIVLTNLEGLLLSHLANHQSSNKWNMVFYLNLIYISVKTSNSINQCRKHYQESHHHVIYVDLLFATQCCFTVQLSLCFWISICHQTAVWKLRMRAPGPTSENDFSILEEAKTG